MNTSQKFNIALAGGMCTGKSTLAANLFVRLKNLGFDYDLIGEEKRKLVREFGDYRSPFERLYIWRQQEREELRSTAKNGFITDSPLFHYYASARLYSQEPRDNLAVRELYRMCLDIEDRYQLIAIAENPEEFSYKSDGCRHSDRVHSNKKHHLVRSFVDHLWPEKLLLVSGSTDERVSQVLEQLKNMGLNFPNP
ncbi:AAA family ATPase [Candidatus Pacearchaeota archaeon]|nr:AAA family ATPase [Candidatus Pacearchaeota archaeon]